MKTITVGNGLVTHLDDDVYETVSKLRWYAKATQDGTVYISRNEKSDSGGKITVRLHHFVLGKPPEGMVVDHVDGNTLNNQRANLRFVTTRQNAQNRRWHREGKLVGASKRKNSRWCSRIRIKGKQEILGYYKTEREAHERYISALAEIHEALPLGL